MIEILITPHIWLQLTPVVRNELAKAFGMKRSTSPVCITERGMTRVESDGFTVSDLTALNAESMQKFLGFQEIDLKANLIALLEMCADRVTPVEEVISEEAIIEMETEQTPAEAPVAVQEAPKKMGRPPKKNV